MPVKTVPVLHHPPLLCCRITSLCCVSLHGQYLHRCISFLCCESLYIAVFWAVQHSLNEMLPQPCSLKALCMAIVYDHEGIHVGVFTQPRSPLHTTTCPLQVRCVP